MEPQTPLPWEEFPTHKDKTDYYSPDYWHDQDEKFALHACNSYLRLVDLLKRSNELFPQQEAKELLKELGEL